MRERERIKRKTLIRHISDGGIGITDFETKVKALKASWVSKLIHFNNDLNQLLNACIERYNLDISYLLNTNITNALDLNIKYLPNFYKEVIWNVKTLIEKISSFRIYGSIEI